MSISNVIKDLKEKGIIPERKPQMTSFGTFQECQQSFKQIFKMVDPTVEEFEYYQEYDQIVEWLSDNKGKGLYLTGSVGTGKSVIMRLVLPVYFRIQYNKNMRVIGLPDFITMDPEDMRDYLNRSIIAIDEFGREPLATDYGKKYEAAPVLIESCEVETKLLFVTTNAKRADIVRRYGEHTMDRIEKLCRIVSISQKSKRK